MGHFNQSCPRVFFLAMSLVYPHAVHTQSSPSVFINLPQPVKPTVCLCPWPETWGSNSLSWPLAWRLPWLLYLDYLFSMKRIRIFFSRPAAPIQQMWTDSFIYILVSRQSTSYTFYILQVLRMWSFFIYCSHLSSTLEPHIGLWDSCKY